MTDREILDRVRAWAMPRFDAAPGSHDWDHTLRVLALCRRIGPTERCDPLVLEAAALLHDVGRTEQDRSGGAICHAARGAEMAAAFLADLPVDAARREAIVHGVRSHRYRGDVPPASAEARSLFDADKLDAVGAVGVARAFLFAGEIGARLHDPEGDPETAAAYGRDDTGYREYRVKLVRVRECMLTAEGRRIAEDRHAFMAGFFDRFLREVAGER